MVFVYLCDYLTGNRYLVLYNIFLFLVSILVGNSIFIRLGQQ